MLRLSFERKQRYVINGTDGTNRPRWRSTTPEKSLDEARKACQRVAENLRIRLFLDASESVRDDLLLQATREAVDVAPRLGRHVAAPVIISREVLKVLVGQHATRLRARFEKLTDDVRADLRARIVADANPELRADAAFDPARWASVGAFLDEQPAEVCEGALPLVAFFLESQEEGLGAS